MVLGLSEDEVKFYEALIENESAVRELSDEILKKIAQELTDNLRKNVTVDWAERESVRARLRLMVNDNPWAKLVPNTREASVRQLTPVAVTGKLDIPVGRVRKMALGPQYLGAFTIGDQLLWGAAEPLRRMLRILLQA